MVAETRDGPEPEQLSSEPRTPRGGGSGRALVMAAAVGAVAVVVVVAGGHHRGAKPHVAFPSPPALTSSPAPAPTADDSVFLEHLGGCTSTDHRHRLTVAFEVTNLGSRPLRVVTVRPLDVDGAALRLDRVRVGTGPCAASGSVRQVRLAPTAATVVALSFRLDTRCPRDSPLAARVTFLAGGSFEHADTSELVDLSRLGFAQC